MLQPPEAKLYEHFVDRSLRELSLGLKLDNPYAGSRKRKIHDALARRNDVPRSAAEKVIEGRFLLGGDDASYLASGLACLWSTVGAAAGEGADDLSLAPASLYAPDAVNGIRRGLLKALERENETMRKEAPKRLPMLMKMLVTVVDFVPDVETATVDLLKSDRLPRTVAERKRVVDFLVKLKTILAEADDSLDSERTLAGRILRSQRGQVAEVARLMQENQRLYAEAKKRSDEYQENITKMGREYSAMLVREREGSGKKLEDEWQEQVQFLKKRAQELGTQLEAVKKTATEKATVTAEAYNKLKQKLAQETAKASAATKAAAEAVAKVKDEAAKAVGEAAQKAAAAAQAAAEATATKTQDAYDKLKAELNRATTEAATAARAAAEKYQELVDSSRLDREAAATAYAALKQKLDAVIVKAAEEAKAVAAKYESLFAASQASGAPAAVAAVDNAADAVEIARLRREAERLTAELQTAQQTVATSQAEYAAKLEEAKRTAQVQIAEQSAAIAQLRTKAAADLQAEKQEAQARLDAELARELKLAHASAAQAAAQLRAEQEAQEQELAAAKREFAEALARREREAEERARADATARAAEAAKVIQAREAEKAALEAQQQQLKTDLEATRARISEMEAAQQQAQKDAEDAEKAEKAQREQEVAALLAQREEQLKRYDALVKTVANLRAQGIAVPELPKGVEEEMEKVSESRKAVYAEQKKQRDNLQTAITSIVALVQATQNERSRNAEARDTALASIQADRDARMAQIATDQAANTKDVMRLTAEWTKAYPEDAKKWGAVLDNWIVESAKIINDAATSDWEKKRLGKQLRTKQTPKFEGVIDKCANDASRQYARKLVDLFRGTWTIDDQRWDASQEAKGRADRANESYEMRDVANAAALVARKQELEAKRQELEELRKQQAEANAQAGSLALVPKDQSTKLVVFDTVRTTLADMIKKGEADEEPASDEEKLAMFKALDAFWDNLDYKERRENLLNNYGQLITIRDKMKAAIQAVLDGSPTQQVAIADAIRTNAAQITELSKLFQTFLFKYYKQDPFYDGMVVASKELERQLQTDAAEALRVIIVVGDEAAVDAAKLGAPEINPAIAYNNTLGGTQLSADGLGGDFSRVAVLRGLVGQRGPTEPASAICAHDDLLPYALPPLDAFARCAVPVRLLLESSPDPTDEDVRAALRACTAGSSSTKRRKLNDDHDEDAESPAAAAEALALLRDNYALIGRTPADELPAERHGVERPHEVRWMPQGSRGESMARVAVMEHAIARCAQVAARVDTGADAAEALRRAAAVLKFGQMGELYALNEAAEFEDAPHPLGTDEPLVTRPCAMVRGTLSFPTDAGVRPLSAAQLLEDEGERPLSGAQLLAKAMGDAAVATASLRNDLRRQGRASHFYVAPPADALELRPACATGVVGAVAGASVVAKAAALAAASAALAAPETPAPPPVLANAPPAPPAIPVAPAAGAGLLAVVPGPKAEPAPPALPPRKLDAPAMRALPQELQALRLQEKDLREKLNSYAARWRERFDNDQRSANDVGRLTDGKLMSDERDRQIQELKRVQNRIKELYPEVKEQSQADSDRRYAAAQAEKAARADRARASRLAAARARGAVANERLRPSDYAADTWRRVINRAIVSVASLTGLEGAEDDDPPDAVDAFLKVHASPKEGAGAVTAQARRDGLWTEMQRHLAISQDRLWIFIRLMSGSIGGDINDVITMANEATLKATKALQDQRLEIAKRVSDTQSKIVETVVASMLKNSKMTMDYKDENLAVIDGEAKKDLKDLASGASGRPFFEANVALKNLTEKTVEAPALKDVLAGLASVGLQMQITLEQSLAEPGAASASLVELSHPSNSYFVSMRPDAVAAIRSAHEMLNSELGVFGGRRRLALWELVEGGCQVLTHRFAELCGFLLVQTRTSTGVSAMYVSHQNIYTNASQARVALAKLVAAASAYIARVSPPAFDAPDPQAERGRVLTAGERVTDISITATPRSMAREPLFAPISSSGWVNIGGRRR